MSSLEQGTEFVPTPDDVEFLDGLVVIHAANLFTAVADSAEVEEMFNDRPWYMGDLDDYAHDAEEANSIGQDIYRELIGDFLN